MINWTNETVMRFLELYQMHPCIWDPKHPFHKNKNRLNSAWIDIKHNLDEPCTIKDLKKKKESLMSAYRGYRTKIRKSETDGSTSDIYQPSWFAYAFMDSFLGNVYTPFRPAYDNQSLQDITDSNNSHDDTSEQNMVIENDPLVNEQKYSAHASFQHEVQIEKTETPSLSTEQISPPPTTSKRKSLNNNSHPELQRTKKQMDQAFNILKTVSQQRLNEGEDECSIFGKLVAKKMRKLPEDRRDFMMIKIHELFYNELHELQRPNSSASMVSY